MMKPVTISLALVALAALTPGMGFAQDATPEVDEATPSPVETIDECLAQADAGDTRREDCIGITVKACPGIAGSTLEMVTCVTNETEIWDAKLNTTYKALMAAYKQQDEDFSDDYDMASRLKAVQRGWIKWRDLKCQFAYDEFRGGTMGRITGADCVLNMTAERAIELEDLLAATRM